MSTTVQPTVEMGFTAELNLPLSSAAQGGSAALKARSFGVLTSIDVPGHAQEKIDVDFAPCVILGACNPSLAHRALQADPRVGLLLPCNVTISEENGRSIVSIVNPEFMLTTGLESDAIAGVAAEATARLRQ
ncbi:MAG: DUF302 domain-containing protein [Thermomicrobiales bacterium]